MTLFLSFSRYDDGSRHTLTAWSTMEGAKIGKFTRLFECESENITVAHRATVKDIIVRGSGVR